MEIRRGRNGSRRGRWNKMGGGGRIGGIRERRRMGLDRGRRRERVRGFGSWNKLFFGEDEFRKIVNFIHEFIKMMRIKDPMSRYSERGRGRKKEGRGRD